MQMLISFSQSSDERWTKSAEISVRPFYQNSDKKFSVAKEPVVVREPSLSGWRAEPGGQQCPRDG